MATTQTSGAVGTARQFTASPPQTYQRQLILPRVGDDIRATETTQGAALAHSLGVLSAAVEQYQQDYDKRQKEIAAKVVPILYGKEDQHTRLTKNSLFMLNQAGFGNLQDNPYALAMIDQLRGQEISAQVHKQYEAYVSQMRLPENLGKEIQNYDDFFNENVQKYVDNITVNNKYALDNGLYETRVINTGKVASKFIADKENEMSINRAESISSFVSENTRNRWKWSDEDRATFANQVGNILSTTQERDPTKRYQILQNMMKTVALNTGDYALIQKIGETPLYDGQTKVNDYIDTEKYKDVANDANKAHFMERTRNIYDKLSTAKDKKSLYSLVDSFDPEDREIASEFIPGRISAIEADERAQRNIEKAMALAKTKAEVGQLNMKAQIEAVMNGQIQDSMGQGIALTASQYKALGFDDDQIAQVISNEIGTLNLDDPTQMTKAMRLAYHPAFQGAFARACVYNASAGINSLTPGGEMSQGLQQVVNLYNRAPELVNHLLSDDSLRASVACIAGEGVDRFMAVRNILGDSEQLKQVDADLEPYIGETLSTSSLPALAGGDAYEGYSYGEPNSGMLRASFKNHARVFRALGYSADSACQEAAYKVASEFYTFNGAPIPKSAVDLVDIGGTDADTARSAFYWVLGSKLKAYCGGIIDPSAVTVNYVAGTSNGSAMITFTTSHGYQQLSLNDIVSEAKADLEQSGNQTYSVPYEEQEQSSAESTNPVSAANPYMPSDETANNIVSSVDSAFTFVKNLFG